MSKKSASVRYCLIRAIFPNAAILQNNANLGRLGVSKASGNTDGDGDYEALYTFGARSFSIWTADGEQIYDSGDRDRTDHRRRATLYFSTRATPTTRKTTAATTKDPNRKPSRSAKPTAELRFYRSGTNRRRDGLRRHQSVRAAVCPIPQQPQLYSGDRNGRRRRSRTRKACISSPRKTARPARRCSLSPTRSAARRPFTESLKSNKLSTKKGDGLHCTRLFFSFPDFTFTSQLPSCSAFLSDRKASPGIF